jgi:hypothetical protein
MTESRHLDRMLDLWLADGATEAPDRVVDVVADRIGRQSQRPAWRFDWRTIPMTRTISPVAAVAAIIIIIGLVGFGLVGGGRSSVTGPPVSPSPAAPSASPSPTAVPSSSVGVGVAGACDLMTTDEAGRALHISSLVTAESLLSISGNLGEVAPSTVPTGFCSFRSGDTSLFVVRYEKGTGADAFAIWKKATGVEAVSGLGDDAAWAPAKTTLYILKGDRLVTIMPMGGTPTLTLEAAKAIGAIVVTRM